MEHYFVDGTKIEANANKYTFVCGKAELVNQDLLELGESSSIMSENWNELCSNSKEHVHFWGICSCGFRFENDGPPY
ncbi:hypothetical protein GCM10010912_68320 [Paenibacillus albidus]|uniref:Uncharacterized protein n=1 Tax=Paenibacillus albidus TaxID=2041023 RepID=A0A917FYI4_9BACL|nr:hypothetical protein GCM10010912_68320 [Paenibacillus albidus]